MTLLFLGLALALMRVPAHAAVQVLTVTTTADNPPNACAGSVCATLRDALTLARTMTSDGSSPIEIDLPSGTITLSQGVLAVGSSTDLFTRIKGATANAGDSVVQQQVTPTTGVFATAGLAGLTTEFQNFTIKGGKFGGAGGGGGVFVGGGVGASAAFTNCILSSNAALRGAIGVASPSSLTVAGSTFTGNIADSAGGAIYFSSSGTLSISSTVFDANVAGTGGYEGDGGAVWASGEASATISLSTFTGNQANGTGNHRGGAVYNNAGSMQISRSRFVGNTALFGSNVLEEPTPGALTADDNWWGTDSGPGTTVAHGIDEGARVSAPVDMVTDWLELRNVASPAALAPGAQATLTADLFGVTGTSTTPLAPGSLDGLAPFPVTGTVFGNPVHGSLSGAGTQFVNGVVTATFTASASLLGPASADATADAQTATAPIAVQAGTATTVGPAPNPSVFGQKVTMLATVTPTVAGTTPATPTGTVQFKEGGSNLGAAVPVTNGVATATVSNLSVGTHAITAAYSGDADFNPSTSAPTTQTVNRSNTTTNASSPSNPSVFGQPVTFTAAVAPVTPGAGTVTGDVVFFVDGQPLPAVPLSAGSATSDPVGDLSVGDHTLAAVYQGTSNYNTSQGFLGGSGQVVNQADTTISIGSSANPSVFGQPVSFTVTVGPAEPAAGTPTGNVSVFLDGGLLQTLSLSGGSASTSPTSTAHAGSHGVTVTYEGDENFNGGTSGTFFQSVNPADTTTTVVSAKSPTVFGEPVTFTATVTATAPGAGTPTGQVRFSAGGADFGTSPLVSGTAVSPPIATLSAGSHTVTATYVPATFVPGFIFTCSPFAPGPGCGCSPFGGRPLCGIRDFNASLGSTGQVVDKAGTSTGVSADHNAPVFGQGVQFTATVTATAPGAGTPTGTVQFKIDGNDAGSPAAVTNGVATSTVVDTLPAGSHAVTAVYSGDAHFNGSTGTLADGLTVNAADTSTQVGSAPDPSIVGQSVQFTATVTATAPGAGTPTGTVQFAADGTDVGAPQGLDEGGAASVATSALALGTHTVTATFLGTSNFNPSSGALEAGQIVVKASSSTAVTSSPNPSLFGQGVTFTATVTSTYAGPPISGQVQFGIDGADRGSPVALSAGSATLGGITDLAAGNHTVTATYTGDGTYGVSTSTLEGGQTVGKAATTTSLGSSPNPIDVNAPVTFTATVTVSAPGAGTPTGTVQFVADGTAVLGLAPVSEGVATLSGATSLIPGTHAVTATYSGDTQFNGSTSAAINQVVRAYPTTTTVTSSVNPSRVGQPVVFSATVASGGGTPTGTVQFTIDGTGAGEPVTLSGGVAASDPITTLGLGTHTVTATYTGVTRYAGSTGALPTQTVIRADTTTTLTPFANPSVFGQPVTFTATVVPIPPGGGMVTGDVAFFLDGQPLSTVPLASGSATTAPVGNLGVGIHVVTAVYQGTSSYTTSSNSLNNQTVGKADTTTTLGSSPNPSTYGQTVTFTATVVPAAPGAGIPTGTVTFFVDGGLLQTLPLGGESTAAASIATLRGGTHTVTAAYAGNGNFNPGTSGPLTQTVNAAGTTTTGVTATVNPSVFGQPVTFRATVAPLPPVTGMPTGQVEFFADGTSFGTRTLSEGSTVSPPLSSLSIGVHTVTATYTGDPSFATSSTSVPVTQTVGQSGSIATVSSSANPSVSGQAVNFTAAITPSGNGGGTPDGSVQFLLDGTDFGAPVTLSGGAATSGSTSSLTVGVHTVEAAYSPGPNYTPTTGAIEEGQTVGKAGASVAVASSNGSRVPGDNVVFTATVGPVAPGAGTPSGTIQFLIDGAEAGGPVTLSGGVATYSTSGLGVGNHTVSGNYGGDATFQSASGSLAGGQTVASPAMADLSVVTQSPPRAVVGLQAAYGIVVTNNGPNDATGVVLGESLPAGWTVAGVASTQGACAIVKASVSCALGDLAYGAQAAVTLVVVPNGPGSVTSAAAVAGVQGDPNSTNNVSAGTTIVRRFGYWIFGSDGGVFTFGDAQFFGSTGSMHLNKAVVAMTSTPSGQGYWLFASDGGVFAFGDAGFFGSTGNAHLNAPNVAMSSTPTGKGYWLAASDGGLFPFGDAGRFGDLSGHRLSAPIVGMAATPTGHGYWLSTDGGVFAFGDAPFLGSMGGQRLNKPMIGLTSNG